MDYRRQHSVPQFYLSAFLADGETKLHVYHKSGIPPHRNSPKDCAVEAHFYSTRGPDNAWDVTIEKELARLEAHAAPCLARLLARQPVDENDRWIIGLFVGAQLFRTTTIERVAKVEEEHVRSPEVTLGWIAEHRSRLEQVASPGQIDEYCAKSRKPELAFGWSQSSTSWISSGTRVAGAASVHSMRWTVLLAPPRRALHNNR